MSLIGPSKLEKLKAWVTDSNAWINSFMGLALTAIVGSVFLTIVYFMLGLVGLAAAFARWTWGLT